MLRAPERGHFDRLKGILRVNPVTKETSSRPNDDAALKALGDKLKARQKASDTAKIIEDKSGMGQGLKYASEFTAATLVGAALGYGADRFLGTAPWGLLVGLFLGFTAGVRNVIRAAREGLEGDIGEDLPDAAQEQE
jgi:ATP synthase protein I